MSLLNLHFLICIFFFSSVFGADIQNTIQSIPSSDLFLTGTTVAVVDHLINKSSLKANSSIQLFMQIASILIKYFFNKKNK